MDRQVTHESKAIESFDIILHENALQRMTEAFISDIFHSKSLGKLIDADGQVWLIQRCEGNILLWSGDRKGFITGSHEDNVRACEGLRWLGLSGWRLPRLQELMPFAKNPVNPLRTGTNNQLASRYGFYVHEGYVDLDYDYPTPRAETSEWASLPCISVSQTVLNDILLDNPFSLVTLHNEKHNWLGELEKYLQGCLINLDYQTNRLPKIDPLTIRDINKGIWEFWGCDPDICDEIDVRPRNPALDVRPGCIAIDFGTSSTVVACESDNGRKELMRVGVRDFADPVVAAHFENPTVLEIVSLENILTEWKRMAYRPHVSWDDVHCSHEARARLHDSHHDTTGVSSILTKLKQWALRQSQDLQVVFTDQQGVEHRLAPLTQNTPARGQLMRIESDYPFDPIELYAWFLGMTINWRGRGLYLEYFMTFPVEYPKAVKEKILASFKRGLQRSLPVTLVTQQEALNRFRVEELASEPAAYAVCALDVLQVEPTSEGTAYAVFDFGGGTTDFDFGFYRLPSDEEADEGYEQVFEHFAPAGDKFLGGENLLENMAYCVFRENLDTCRKYQIVFTRPLDAESFPGAESLLESSQAAYSNTLLLISQLREFWEDQVFRIDENSDDVTKSVELFNRDGDRKQCDLIFPYASLESYLENRIGLGIEKFVSALGQAFDPLPAEIHILLAGNASRSRWVARLFGCDSDPQDNDAEPLLIQRLRSRFGHHMPDVHIHPPLESHDDEPYHPSAKTGVALGLLDLRPGGVIKVINRTRQQSQGEAGFAFYVGRTRLGKFMTGLPLNAPYQQWYELGPQREGIFELLYTQTPLAQTGELVATDNEVKRLRMRYAVYQKGDKVFARATAPNEIELALAVSLEAIASPTTQFETLVLK